MIIITVISVLFVFVFIAALFTGRILGAFVIALAIVGLAAINAPLDNYFN